MKIKTLKSFIAQFGTVGAGVVIDVSDDQAVDFLNDGLAELVLPEKDREQATAKPKQQKATTQPDS